ncbi:DUF433 domain-containing protein [Glycomyces buryatensis]|uniref:DUF433 domain-containing protein n=2 Tax=Glycomyces buryatensis TaxID=2570927 RepID=A0A4S8QAZ9_9ACTN|nr:DUF433 domain-containing protein [Glycomyces buryatensis]
MTYEPKLAAALTGATMRQLAYWRRPRGESKPLLQPEISEERPILYSFRDLIALRTFVSLREQFSLQKIRKALNKLRDSGEMDHLSRYTLVGDASTIYLVEHDRGTDLLRRPGQQVIVEVVDILKPYYHQGRQVPDLLRPRPHMIIDTGIRGGEPVIEGTRVPFEDVAGLMRDGVPSAEIRDYYPSVSADAANDALDFAEYVDSYTEASRPLLHAVA